jgi:DNA mismatch repair protein MutL
MSKIRVMPESLANKIAAGEVVERPASAVKELLENALDARTTRINVEIEIGGKRLIRVVDDGEGMTRDDAITAFERHATSKLRTVEDLETITTLGFRGEALPSIASVSRLILRTKVATDPVGTEVEFNGGRLAAVRDVAWPGGTEVEVRELFFNVPARRKFLKSDATETYHVVNLVQHYALARPDTGFLLVSNGREALRVEPVQSLRERAYQILGGSLLEKLVEVDNAADGLRIYGFVSNPQEQRSSRDAQYLFVNRRFVRDQLLGRALSEAYRSMMPSGTHPAAVLFIEVPPTEVDVNVHPAKTEVRFLHEHSILGFVSGSIADALPATRPVTRLGSTIRAAGYAGADRTSAPSDVAVEPAITRRPANEASGESTGEAAPTDKRFSLESPEVHGATDKQQPLDLSFGGGVRPEAREQSAHPAAAESGSVPPAPYSDSSCGTASPFEMEGGLGGLVGDRRSVENQLPGLGHGIKPLGQIRDSYIVATDEEGLLLIDQHVAHERILFEQVRDAAGSGSIQPLLIPETVDLTPAEASAFEVVQAELDSHGIETMQLSGRTVAIKTTPAGLSPADALAVVRELLVAVERARRDFSIDKVREEIAASVACKAAIKINMPLTDEKMQWLIDELMKTRNPMTCPHGRPILMRFGLRDIERGFKRPV